MRHRLEALAITNIAHHHKNNFLAIIAAFAIIALYRANRDDKGTGEMTLITVTEHDKNEWSRMAKAAYMESRNPIGHRYSMAAALRHGEQMRIDIYDTLMRNYRNWLIGGFDYIPE